MDFDNFNQRPILHLLFVPFIVISKFLLRVYISLEDLIESIRVYFPNFLNSSKDALHTRLPHQIANITLYYIVSI